MYYLHGDGMRRLGRPAPVQRSAAGSISPHLVRGAGLQDSTVVRTAQAKAFMAHFFALRKVVSLVPVRPQMAVAVRPAINCHSRVPVASGSYLLASLAGSTRLSISAYLPIRPSARPPLPARPTPRPPPPGTLQTAEHPLNAARRGGQTI